MKKNWIYDYQWWKLRLSALKQNEIKVNGRLKSTGLRTLQGR